jgi:phage terminase large subunit GpA-like protein
VEIGTHEIEIDAADIYRPASVAKIHRALDALPDDAAIPTPVEWQEQNRYMPAEITEHYGQFDRMTVPHLIEPLNCVDPENPATHIAVMKSVQSAATVTLIEGAIGYFIRYKLGSCMYLTATKGGGRIRSSSALDVLIDNAGLAPYLKPISSRMQRKTADTTYYKEFSGGVKLLITSYNSIADLKSNTFNLLCRDEWDEAGVELKDQGDVAGIIEGRTMGVRFYKILDVSTPTRLETSRIYKSFIEGDQCRYYVPCPICGKFQVLTLKGMGKEYGLTFNMIKNEKTGAKMLDVTSVRYICEHCKAEFSEAHKQGMLEKGEWQPTWEQSEYSPKSPYHRSFHVQGLISPFLSWTRICQQFVNTRFGEELMLFKDFTLNYMGNPWASQSKRQSWQDVYDRRGEYKAGDVPPGVLQMTGGCDVHADRIEALVVGWGKGAESWIIEKRIFFGKTEDPNGAVWAELAAWAPTYEKTIKGGKWGITLLAIDQGYNPTERAAKNRPKDYARKPQIVQDFVAVNPHFISVRGVVGQQEIVKGHKVQGGALNLRYDVATDVLKEDIFARLDRTEGDGAIHFPDFEKENFKQFCSEVFKELKPGSFGWGKVYERNEVLDCYVYALAVAWYLGIPQRAPEVWDEYEQNMVDIAKSGE